MDNDVRKLIEFLADDCGWPLEEEQIDRSAWPVNNAELGLNDEVSIDSVEVFELRPLTTNQPWGVFFVSVKGSSNLSMFLLRRLLRGLVKKKRASANTSNLQQWDLEDLIFVCSLDDPENVTRYFAHFKEQEKGLPKLMIGARWQDSQPESEIKAAKLKLKSNLKWPSDEKNIESWREDWAKAFPIGHKEVIKTSAQLSKTLAKYALKIKNNIPEIHSIEDENGPIHTLHEAFKESLIDNLKIEDFADMVAQTITYGLFSARATGTELIGIETLSESIPPTNPFLRDLFYEFSQLSGTEPTDLDFDELAIADLVLMLNEVNINSVMQDFGSQFKSGKEDPVIHFYETFLKEYDSKRRAERGVFYTPKPVVEFIVRMAHQNLIEEHNLQLGLADVSTHVVDGVEWPKVMILDPATGTGTFIESVIDLIHKTMIDHWKDNGRSIKEVKELWDEYVEKHLLTRVFGFELMMAPYAIAHLKIGLKLLQTGYSSISQTRLNVFLTNSLTEPKPLAKWLPSFISKESKAANIVKSKVPITVILGNPPYSGKSMNNSKWIHDLMRTPFDDGSNDYFSFDGKPLKERTVKWINDDYVKFIRISQHQISKSKFGIIGMITNNGYFDNPTFRGVRESLMHTFSSISIIDLHGSANKKEKTPDGSKDENVFDIRTGVGIGIFSKIENCKNLQLKHCDIWGLRESKYDQLAAISSENDVSSKITPDGEFLLFTPVDKDLSKEFNCGVKITEIMPLHGAGMTTARDKFAIDKSKEDLAKRIEAFGKSIGTNEEVCEKFSIKLKKGWDCSKARFQLGSIKDYDQYIREVSYRPFDTRYIFYHDSAVWRTVKKIMPHMSYPNLAFAVSRSVRGAPWRDVLVTKDIMEFGYIATRPGNTAPLFPMFVYDLKDLNSTKRKYNFKLNLLNSLNRHLSHKVEGEELFYYIYSILNSNLYRHKYSKFIAIDFPKIPFTNDLSLFSELSNLSKKLTEIQLMKSVEPSVKVVFKGEGDNQVGTMSEKSLRDGRLYINDTQYFDGISESLYDYHIGSYRICHKWLKDRKGENLSKNDIIYYRKMMSVIEQSKSLVDEIDNLITKKGGFPLLGSLDFEYDDSLPDGQQKLI